MLRNTHTPHANDHHKSGVTATGKENLVNESLSRFKKDPANRSKCVLGVRSSIQTKSVDREKGDSFQLSTFSPPPQPPSRDVDQTQGFPRFFAACPASPLCQVYGHFTSLHADHLIGTAAVTPERASVERSAADACVDIASALGVNDSPEERLPASPQCPLFDMDEDELLRFNGGAPFSPFRTAMSPTGVSYLAPHTLPTKPKREYGAGNPIGFAL
eukprot:NODE_977_length_1193_cov_499.778846_g741_i0.p1 GENE.NODE_977_length_1193_cov_499.778846_g741_i0~~NODE_977_length_1193_cov_499.778846_g741_i0.p1  ORF type:complete len:216 (-),score=32.34 NODE_977_length_1193_cov_499.778846_g741_i0:466-1113(-)